MFVPAESKKRLSGEYSSQSSSAASPAFGKEKITLLVRKLLMRGLVEQDNNALLLLIKLLLSTNAEAVDSQEDDQDIIKMVEYLRNTKIPALDQIFNAYESQLKKTHSVRVGLKNLSSFATTTTNSTKSGDKPSASASSSAEDKVESNPSVCIKQVHGINGSVVVDNSELSVKYDDVISNTNANDGDDMTRARANAKSHIDAAIASLKNTSPTTDPNKIEHKSVRCDECKTTSALTGLRFKCLVCRDYDLCPKCYEAGLHDHDHAFQLIPTPNATPQKLAPRNFLPSATVSLTGISVAFTPMSSQEQVQFEVKIVKDGRMRIGWAMETDNRSSLGFLSDTSIKSKIVGDDEKGFSWGFDGLFVYHKSQIYNIINGSPLKTGDIVGCTLNHENGSIGFTVNGNMVTLESDNSCLNIPALATEGISYFFYPVASFGELPKKKLQQQQIVAATTASASEEVKASESSDKPATEATTTKAPETLPSTTNEKVTMEIKFIIDKYEKSASTTEKLEKYTYPRCIKLSGDGYVSVPGPIDLKDSLTIQATLLWTPPFDANSSLNDILMFQNGIYPIASRGSAESTLSNGLLLAVLITGELYFRLGTTEYRSICSVILPGRWATVTLSYSPYGGASFYVNGIRVESQKVASNQSSSSSSSSSTSTSAYSYSSYRSISSSSTPDNSVPIFFGAQDQGSSTRPITINSAATSSSKISKTILSKFYQKNYQVKKSTDSKKPYIYFYGHMIDICMASNSRCYSSFNALQSRKSSIVAASETLLRLKLDEGCGFVAHSSEGSLPFHVPSQLVGNVSFVKLPWNEYDEADESMSKDSASSSSMSAAKLQRLKIKSTKDLVPIISSEIERVCETYINSIKDNHSSANMIISPPPFAVSPSTLSFSLIFSILRHIHMVKSSIDPIEARDLSKSLLTILLANIKEMKLRGIPVTSVGLGDPVAASLSNPLLRGAKNSLSMKLEYIVFDIASTTQDEDASALCLDIIVEGFRSIFFWSKPEVFRFLYLLLHPEPESCDFTLPNVDDLASHISKLPPNRREYLLSMVSDKISNDSDLLNALFTSMDKSNSDQSKSETSNVLQWSISTVISSLQQEAAAGQLPSKTGASLASSFAQKPPTISKRQVIQYILQVAPQYWIEENKLNQKLKSLSKALTADQVIDLYTRLEAVISSQQGASNGSQSNSIHFPRFTANDLIDISSKSLQLLKSPKSLSSLERLLRSCLLVSLGTLSDQTLLNVRKGSLSELSSDLLLTKLMNSSSKESSTSSSSNASKSTQVYASKKSSVINQKQMIAWDLFLTVNKPPAISVEAATKADNSNAATTTTTTTGETEEGNEKKGEESKSKDADKKDKNAGDDVWYWRDNDVSGIMEDDDENDDDDSQDNKKKPKSLMQLAFDPAKCSQNINLSPDLRTCSQNTSKVWGVVITKQGFKQKTGIHRWYIKVDKCNSRGYLFVGIAGAQVRASAYLGSDEKGLGVLFSGDIYHSGTQKKASVLPRDIFVTGSIVEMTLDTNEGVLKIAETVGAKRSYVIADKTIMGNDMFVAMGDTIYPAISFNEPGDILSLHGHVLSFDSLESISSALQYDPSANDKSQGGDDDRKLVNLSSNSHFLLYSSQLLKTLLELLDSFGKESVLSIDKFQAFTLFSKTLRAVLSVLCRWDHPSDTFADENIDTLRNLLNEIEKFRTDLIVAKYGNQVSHQQVCKWKQGSKQCEICSTLIEIEVLISLFVGKIGATWILSEPQPIKDEEPLPPSKSSLLEQTSETKGEANAEAEKNTAEKEIPMKVFDEWLASPIFSGGLINQGDLSTFTHLFATPQSSIDSNKSESENEGFWRAFVEGGLSKSKSSSSSATSALLLDAWVEKHLQSSGSKGPLSRRRIEHQNRSELSKSDQHSKQAFSRSQRAVIVALLYHTGRLYLARSLARALEEAQALIPNEDIIDHFSGVTPPLEIKEIWEAANNIRLSLARQLNDKRKTNLDLDDTPVWTPSFIGNVYQLARFLTELELPFDMRVFSINFTETVTNIRASFGLPLTSSLEPSLGISPSVSNSLQMLSSRSQSHSLSFRSSSQRSINNFSITAKRSVSLLTGSKGPNELQVDGANMISSISRFLIQSLDDEKMTTITKLKNMMKSRRVCAMKRERGMRLFSDLLVKFPNGLSHFPVRAALLLPLPNALRGMYRGWIISPDGKIDNPNIPAWHYLDGLKGCGKRSIFTLSSSYRDLVSVVSTAIQSLNNASSIERGSIGLQLALFECFAVRILPCDHEALLNCDFFGILHRAIENSRSAQMTLENSMETAEDDTGTNNQINANKDGPAQLQLIIKASLKLVFLLCHQIASGSPNQLTSNQQLSPINAMPALMRERSGPDTLSSSVFQLLYDELYSLTNEIIDLQESLAYTMSQMAEKSKQEEGSQPIDKEEMDSLRQNIKDDQSRIKKAEMQISDIIELLISVSSSSSCANILQSSKWLNILLKLLHHSSDVIIASIALLLQILLPISDPEAIELDLPRDSDESNDEYDAEPSVDETLFGKISSKVDFFGPQGLVKWFLVHIAEYFYAIGENSEDDKDAQQSSKSLLCLIEEASVSIVRTLTKSSTWQSTVFPCFEEILSSFSYSTDNMVEYSMTLAVLDVLGGHFSGFPIGLNHKLYPTHVRFANSNPNDPLYGVATHANDLSDSQFVSVRLLSSDGTRYESSSIRTSSFEIVPTSQVLPPIDHVPITVYFMACQVAVKLSAKHLVSMGDNQKQAKKFYRVAGTITSTPTSVRIRAGPSLTAKELGSKLSGAIIEGCDRKGPWIKLANPLEYGSPEAWMLSKSASDNEDLLLECTPNGIIYSDAKAINDQFLNVSVVADDKVGDTTPNKKESEVTDNDEIRKSGFTYVAFLTGLKALEQLSYHESFLDSIKQIMKQEDIGSFLDSLLTRSLQMTPSFGIVDLEPLEERAYYLLERLSQPALAKKKKPESKTEKAQAATPATATTASEKETSKDTSASSEATSEATATAATTTANANVDTKAAEEDKSNSGKTENESEESNKSENVTATETANASTTNASTTADGDAKETQNENETGGDANAQGTQKSNEQILAELLEAGDVEAIAAIMANSGNENEYENNELQANISQIVDMGYAKELAELALAETGGDIAAALDWIDEHERNAAENQGNEENGDEEEEEEDGDGNHDGDDNENDGERHDESSKKKGDSEQKSGSNKNEVADGSTSQTPSTDSTKTSEPPQHVPAIVIEDHLENFSLEDRLKSEDRFHNIPKRFEKLGYLFNVCSPNGFHDFPSIDNRDEELDGSTSGRGTQRPGDITTANGGVAYNNSHDVFDLSSGSRNYLTSREYRVWGSKAQNRNGYANWILALNSTELNSEVADVASTLSTIYSRILLLIVVGRSFPIKSEMPITANDEQKLQNKKQVEVESLKWVESSFTANDKYKKFADFVQLEHFKQYPFVASTRLKKLYDAASASKVSWQMFLNIDVNNPDIISLPKLISKFSWSVTLHNAEFLDRIVEKVSDQLKVAATKDFCDMTTSLLRYNVTSSDMSTMQGPNLWFIEWATSLVCSSWCNKMDHYLSQTLQGSEPDALVSIFTSWIQLLYSPSVEFKMRASRILCSILAAVIDIAASKPDPQIRSHVITLLKRLLGKLPRNRIVATAERRLLKECDNEFQYSYVTQDFVDLASRIKMTEQVIESFASTQSKDDVKLTYLSFLKPTSYLKYQFGMDSTRDLYAPWNASFTLKIASRALLPAEIWGNSNATDPVLTLATPLNKQTGLTLIVKYNENFARLGVEFTSVNSSIHNFFFPCEIPYNEWVDVNVLCSYDQLSAQRLSKDTDLATTLSMDAISASQTLLLDGILSMKLNGYDVGSRLPIPLASARFPISYIGNDSSKSFIGDIALFSLQTSNTNKVAFSTQSDEVDIDTVVYFDFMKSQDVDVAPNDDIDPLRKFAIDSNRRFTGASLCGGLRWNNDADGSLASYLSKKSIDLGTKEQAPEQEEGEADVSKILSTREYARYLLFIEGANFVGTISRNASKTLPSGIASRLLDGEGDEETGNQLEYFTTNLKGDSKSFNKSEMKLNISGHVIVRVGNFDIKHSVSGFVQLNDGRIEFNLNDDKPELKWMEKFYFVGIEQLGKIEGQWMSYCSIMSLPPLKDKMIRANVQSCPPFIRLGEGATMLVHDYKAVPVLGNVIFNIGAKSEGDNDSQKTLSEEEAKRIFKDEDCNEFFNKINSSTDDGLSKQVSAASNNGEVDEAAKASSLIPPVWACPACTFENELSFSSCQICGHAYESNSEEEQNDDGGDDDTGPSSIISWDGKGFIFKNSGIYFWEVQLGATVSSGCSLGVARPGVRLDKKLGFDKHSWAILMNGQKRSGDKSQSYAKGSLRPNDIIGVEVDTESASGGTIRFFHNGKDCGIAFEKIFDEEDDKYGLAPCISLQRYGDTMTMLGFKNGKGNIVCHQDDTLGRKSFAGNWKDGSCFGYGVMELTDGSTHEGVWIGENREGCHRITKLVTIKKEVALSTEDGSSSASAASVTAQAATVTASTDISESTEAIKNESNNIATTATATASSSSSDSTAVTTQDVKDSTATITSIAAATTQESTSTDEKKEKETVQPSEQPPQPKEIELTEKRIEYRIFVNGIDKGAGTEDDFNKFIEEWKQREVESLKESKIDNATEIPTQVMLRGTLSASTHFPFILDPQSCQSSYIKLSEGNLAAEYDSKQSHQWLSAANAGVSLGGSTDGEAGGPTTMSSKCMVLGTEGYNSGVHYWEVRILGMEWGSTYIGVTEKPVMHQPIPSAYSLVSTPVSDKIGSTHSATETSTTVSTPSATTTPTEEDLSMKSAKLVRLYGGSQTKRLNSLQSHGSGWGVGCGFVNYRAILGLYGEEMYGSFYGVGDTVGVLLDMDRGEISFWKCGQDMNSPKPISFANFGIAYSRMRINCKNRGANVIPTLYPCFGFSKKTDKVTLVNSRYVSLKGRRMAAILNEASDAACLLYNWKMFSSIDKGQDSEKQQTNVTSRLVHDSYRLFETRDKIKQYRTFGNRKIELNCTESALLAATSHIYANEENPLKIGMRIVMERGNATILGVKRGCVWYLAEGENEVFYWPPTVLQSLIRENTVRIPASATTSTSASPSLSSIDEGNNVKKIDIIPYNNFLELTECKGDGKWTDAIDFTLVSIVNYVSDSLGKDPSLILGSIDVYVSQLQEAADGKSNKSTLGDVMIQEMGVDAIKDLIKWPVPVIQARLAMILSLNNKVQRMLPYIDFSFVAIGKLQVSQSSSLSTTASQQSLGQSFCKMRQLIFTRTKLSHWNDIVEATVSFTPLPADQYDRAQSIPEIVINRVRAGAHRLKAIQAPDERLKRSVFGQLKSGLSTFSSDKYRKAYSHVQDAGQRRSFFVKFEGEGVDDHGGPYRAAIQQAIEEEAAGGPLEVMVPCPNADSGAMINRDKIVFPRLEQKKSTTPLLDSTKRSDAINWHERRQLMREQQQNGAAKAGQASSSSSSSASTETSKSSGVGARGNLDCAKFLGKLVGTAVRHDLQIALNLPMLIWKPLVHMPVGWKELFEVDTFNANSLKFFETISKEEWEASLQDNSDLLLERVDWGSKEVLEKVSKLGNLPYELRNLCIQIVLASYLKIGSELLAGFAYGLGEVLPIELFGMFTPNELDMIICGKSDIDVNILRQVAEYRGIEPESDLAKYLWEALEKMNQFQRSKFINFVSARSRLPTSADKFPMNFTIQPLQKSQKKKDGSSEEASNDDALLPQSQTCFFTLSLPNYTSSQICFDRLVYASMNCNTMSDFELRGTVTGFED